MTIPGKQTRRSVALDAANVGQLTRLCEQVVDSIASADRDESDNWQLKKGSLLTAAMKSTFHQVIHEAAALGQLKRLEPVIVTNSNYDEEEQEPQEQPQTPYQESRRRIQRASSLVDGFVEESKKQKAKSWSADNSTLDKLEQLEEASTILSPLSTTTTPYEALPSPVVPHFRKRFSGMTRHKLTECLAQGVAEGAHARAWRLQQEQQIKVRTSCHCVYCQRPSPHQTLHYQQLRYHQVLTNGTTAIIEFQDRPLPTPLIPTFVKAKCDRGLSEANLRTEVCQKAAVKAWERNMQLKKRGIAHRVTDRCLCVYCKVGASPLQTIKYKALTLESPFDEYKERKILQVATGDRHKGGLPASPSTNITGILSPRKTSYSMIPPPPMTSPTPTPRPTLSSFHLHTSRRFEKSIPSFCSPPSSRERFSQASLRKSEPKRSKSVIETSSFVSPSRTVLRKTPPPNTTEPPTRSKSTLIGEANTEEPSPLPFFVSHKVLRKTTEPKRSKSMMIQKAQPSLTSIEEPSALPSFVSPMSSRKFLRKPTPKSMEPKRSKSIIGGESTEEPSALPSFASPMSSRRLLRKAPTEQPKRSKSMLIQAQPSWTSLRSTIAEEPSALPSFVSPMSSRKVLCKSTTEPPKRSKSMMIDAPSRTSPKLPKTTSNMDKSCSPEEESNSTLPTWVSPQQSRRKKVIVSVDCTSFKRKSEPAKPSWTSPQLRKTSSVHKDDDSSSADTIYTLPPWATPMQNRRKQAMPQRESSDVPPPPLPLLEPFTPIKSWRKSSFSSQSPTNTDDTTALTSSPSLSSCHWQLPQLSLDDDVDEEDLWAQELHVDDGFPPLLPLEI